MMKRKKNNGQEVGGDTNVKGAGRPAVALTERLVRDALIMSHGVVAQAANSLGVSRPTMYKYMDKFELYKYNEDLKKRLDDVALNTIVEDLDNVETAKWYLGWRQRLILGNNSLQLSLGDSKVSIVVDTAEDAASLNKFLNAGKPEDIDYEDLDEE